MIPLFLPGLDGVVVIELCDCGSERSFSTALELAVSSLIVCATSVLIAGPILRL